MLGQINMIGRQNYVEYIKEGQGFGEIDLFLGSREYEYFALARTDIKVLGGVGTFFLGYVRNKLRASQQNYIQYAGNICFGGREKLPKDVSFDMRNPPPENRVLSYAG